MIEVEGVSCDPQRTLVYSHSNIIDSTVGIEEFASTSISIYPNPASTSVNLQVNSNFIGKDFIIYDALGKQIQKQKILSTNTTINASAFAAGNYVMKADGVDKRFEIIK
jgi:hypothetical protein